jgi:hypothetical protein
MGLVFLLTDAEAGFDLSLLVSESFPFSLAQLLGDLWHCVLDRTVHVAIMNTLRKAEIK